MNRYLLYILGAAALVSCSDDVVEEAASYLNGKEKTPITVSALLDVKNSAQTRAKDMEFNDGDELIAYLRHVTWNGSTDGVRTSVVADQAPCLVTFTKGSTDMTAYSGSDITPIGTNAALGLTSTNTQQATDLTADPVLYWDDFSNSVDAAYDLRTEGHYLQSYYGYCYNGGTPTAPLTDETQITGVLGWTVATDQSEGFKTSDLLWSYEQTPVAYSHATTREGLVLPYTHAMSKVTIEVVCADGFDDVTTNFSDASVVLQQMNTVCTLSAPDGTITATGTPANITMFPIANDNLHQSFSALIAQTTFNDGLVLAKINGIDGNNYTLKLSDATLNTEEANDWASKLTGYTSETKSGTTQPGVHYMITVTIKKQQITVSATIKDWDYVSATGVGEIHFANDITTKGEIAAALQDKGFDLYKKTTAEDAEYGIKATTVSWSTTDSKWMYTPTIYWQNLEDKEFFRALSGADPDDEDTPDNESIVMSQGRDVLWGTTPAHSGPEAENPTLSYGKGDAIFPRTGDVPLAFEHAMSKITVNLATTEGADAVTLAGAKISIANIYDNGIIDLNDGSIGSLGIAAESKIPISGYLAANASGDGTKLSEVVVIPQKLTYMKDGTTARDGAVAFYNAGELMTLNDGKTYATSTLQKVLYSADDANDYNATLGGNIKTSMVKTPAEYYDTDEKVAAKNATLPDAVKIGDPKYYTLVEFRNLTNDQISEDLFNTLNIALKAQHYTLVEYLENNSEKTADDYAALSEDQKRKLYSLEEYRTLIDNQEYSEEDFNSLPIDTRTKVYDFAGYHDLTPAIKPFKTITPEAFAELEKNLKQNGVYEDQASVIAYNNELPGAVQINGLKSPAVNYSEAEVIAHNAALEGAVKEGDIKEYRTKEGSVEAQPGDLKDTTVANPKIMMLIMLADGTTYTLDLAKCQTLVGGELKDVDEWKRGEHYTYTISLSKTEITFRAMIKDWVEKQTTGNATLEWD